MNEIVLCARSEDTGKRVDVLIAQESDLSRAFTQKLIQRGDVLVNGEPAVKSTIIEEGDVLRVNIPVPDDTEIKPQDIPLDIFYEDKNLLVVNKPKGMVVHPAAGNTDNTLVNALLYHCAGGLSGIGGKIRPGIVHRIDKDTSGLLVIAKDDETHKALSEQFACHSINRIYKAVVYGRFSSTEGVVDAPIGRSDNDRKKMGVTNRSSKNAVTMYHVLATYKGFSFLQLKLQTGRTHQIRVHMAYIGHPVAGDAIYGPKKVIKELEGQCLHAGVLGFFHPKLRQQMDFESPLPEYFTNFLKKVQGSAVE